MNNQQRRKFKSERGFTLLEMLASLLIAGIIIATAAVNLKSLNSPLQNGAVQTASFFKEVRAKAVSATFAYLIYPTSTTNIATKYGNTCATATTVDSRLTLKLPTGSRLASTTWSFCFSTRGLADGSLTIGVNDAGTGIKNIEVLLGGSIRIL